MPSFRIIAEVIADELRSAAPMDTGKTRESVTVTTSRKRTRGKNVREGYQVRIPKEHFPGAYYPAFVEHGTRNMEADPFVRPTMFRAKAMIKNMAAQLVQDRMPQMEKK